MTRRVTVVALLTTVVALVGAQIAFAGKPGSSSARPLSLSTKTDPTCGSDNGDGHTVWFSWVAPASGGFSASTFGSSYDTSVVVYDNSLNEIACNDDHTFATNCPAGTTDNLCSDVPFTATANETYYIAVWPSTP